MRIRSRSIYLLAGLFVISIVGCDSSPSADRGVAATVRRVNVEGGCWALDTTAGRVQPLDLPQEFRQDGLEVYVVLRDAPAMMSACQVGALKHVDSITRREADRG